MAPIRPLANCSPSSTRWILPPPISSMKAVNRPSRTAEPRKANFASSPCGGAGAVVGPPLPSRRKRLRTIRTWYDVGSGGPAITGTRRGGAPALGPAGRVVTGAAVTGERVAGAVVAAEAVTGAVSGARAGISARGSSSASANAPASSITATPKKWPRLIEPPVGSMPRAARVRRLNAPPLSHRSARPRSGVSPVYNTMHSEIRLYPARPLVRGCRPVRGSLRVRLPFPLLRGNVM